jgi:hypothetical protein
MLVFWKARLVLLAVPKTGSTALEAAFCPGQMRRSCNPPRLKHMTVRRYRRQLAGLLEQDGRNAGTDGDHARAGRLAVELVSLSLPPGAGGQPQSTAGVGFADFVEAWLSDDAPEYARSDGSRASCRRRQARSGSITCSATTGWTTLDFLERPRRRLAQIGRRNVSPGGRGQRSAEADDETAARRGGRGIRAVGQALRPGSAP